MTKKLDRKVKLSIEKEARLRRATIYLASASALIGESASGTEPFKASKFLNVLHKAIGDLRAELLVFLGDFKLDEIYFDLTTLNSRRILNSLFGDEE